MILLWGIMEDLPMSMAYAALRQVDADIFFLDHRKIFTSEIEYRYDPDNGAQCMVHCDDKSLDLSRVNAAYIRPYNFHDYGEMENKTFADPLAMKAAMFESHLYACLDASDKLILNKTNPSATNNSKPHQLSFIQKAGFKIPETFISNDGLDARNFLAAHPESIFKSISGVRSIVHRISDAHLERIDDVQWCPTLFQKVVPGINYRVHVVGNNLFTLAIQSDELDYRYGNTTMSPVVLPDEIANKCLTLNTMLGLKFSGIDLMRTPDDEWYCFEVNPSPAYSHFENQSGIPISKALARYMYNADRESAIQLSPKSYQHPSYEYSDSSQLSV